MVKKLLGRAAAFAVAASVCLGAFNLGATTAKAKTEFGEKSGVQAVALDTKVQGSVTKEVTQQWYQFTAGADKKIWYTFEFKSVGLPTARMGIYDADGANIKTISCEKDESDKYVTKLDPGATYYIQAYSYYDYPGSFVFSVNTEADEGDTIETATPIGYEYSGVLAHLEDVDYLAFNSGNNTACTVTVKNIDAKYSNIYAQIFNADGTMVEDYFGIDRAEAKSQTVLLKKNKTYYLKVNNSGNNSRNIYKVSITGRVDEPGTKKASKSVKIKKNVKGVLDTKKDEDWFKVKLNKKKNWKFTLKNITCDGTAYITVYKGNKELGYVGADKADNKTFMKYLKKGTYYIKISGVRGDYSFKVK